MHGYLPVPRARVVQGQADVAVRRLPHARPRESPPSFGAVAMAGGPPFGRVLRKPTAVFGRICSGGVGSGLILPHASPDRNLASTSFAISRLTMCLRPLGAPVPCCRAGSSVSGPPVTLYAYEPLYARARIPSPA